MHNHKSMRANVQIFKQIMAFLPSLFWLLLIYGFDEPLPAGITVICALLHELGHITFLLLKNNGKLHIRSTLSGFRIKRYLTHSYIEDAWLYASGPIANILSAVLILSFPNLPYDYKELFISLNLVTAISNLLPIRTYDGYGIIFSLLMHYEAKDTFLSLLYIVSFFLTAILSFLSLYIVSRIGNSYWMAGLFIVMLVGEVSERLKHHFSRFSEF